MFDLENYYYQCATQPVVDNTGVFNYISSYKNIVLWGASHTGKAVGKKFLDEKMNFVYWDERHKDLGEVNGVKVIENFTGDFDPSETIVVVCIPNHVILPFLIGALKEKGYSNIIRGDILFSGALCRVSRRSELTAKECWGKLACRPIICSRAKSIMQNDLREEKPGERIDFHYSVFILTSKCNLRCMHCVQCINDYPEDKRINVPFERVQKDIHVFLTTVDSVGVISAMGGETFMHPEIGRIAVEFSKHNNFGFLSLPTNGLFPIKREQLEGMEDKRIVIAFGYYLHVANERQKEIYQKNVELVRSCGIACTESQPLPTWFEPSRLEKVDMSVEYMMKNKQGCTMPPRNLQIRDGKIHICDESVALHAAGYADYPDDYLDLTKNCTLEERRNKLRALIDRPFYHTCGHCRISGNMVPAAVQGVLGEGADPQSFIKLRGNACRSV